MTENQYIPPGLCLEPNISNIGILVFGLRSVLLYKQTYDYCHKNNTTYWTGYILQSSVSNFRKISGNIPSSAARLRKGLWHTTSISLIVAILEMVLALAVSLLGVSLAAPESLINRRRYRSFCNMFLKSSPTLQINAACLYFCCRVLLLLFYKACRQHVHVLGKQGWLAQEISSYINHCLFKKAIFTAHTSGMLGRKPTAANTFDMERSGFHFCNATTAFQHVYSSHIFF